MMSEGNDCHFYNEMNEQNNSFSKEQNKFFPSINTKKKTIARVIPPENVCIDNCQCIAIVVNWHLSKREFY